MRFSSSRFRRANSFSAFNLNSQVGENTLGRFKDIEYEYEMQE
jgi:hypothetical protein